MAPRSRSKTAERRRLDTIGPESDLSTASDWYEWGPYLAERAWGPEREDDSADGDACSSSPHECFRGDNGAGRAMSHQIGRTARVVGLLLDPPSERLPTDIGRPTGTS